MGFRIWLMAVALLGGETPLDLYNQGVEAQSLSQSATAIRFYLRSARKEVGNPVLEESLYYNLALARLQFAENLPKNRGQYHVDQAYLDWARAEKSACEVAKLKGERECSELFKPLQESTFSSEKKSLNPLVESLKVALVAVVEGKNTKALTLGKDFLLLVEKRQRQELGCHKVPWDRVLPLFTSGWEALEKGDIDFALLDWESAYVLLNIPYESSSPEYDEQFQALETLTELNEKDQKRTFPTHQPSGW